ncbi:hypothetical protein [Clostridium beijerinckii]|uniref:hypothetical protein n=1 Tax=Clostridium beijerinckii TaxID=1520 RepID=UPI00232C25FA|nr:hypothetical protein [Clostridium beijerinckii]
MNIKYILESIKTILEILNLLNPLMKLAWPKIKKYFRERKKTLVEQIINKENTFMEYFGINNIIILA